MSDDVFGHGIGQASLFGDGDGRIPNPAPISYAPRPEDVRRRLQDMLDTVRAAERMPWDARRAKSYQTIFPQMANWLPGEEAEDFRVKFAREMERLMAA